jgi:hypothetical protein
MRIDIETAGEAFPEFWERIGAAGDLEAALRELQVHHHAGTEQRSTPRETPPQTKPTRAGWRALLPGRSGALIAGPAARCRNYQRGAPSSPDVVTCRNPAASPDAGREGRRPVRCVDHGRCLGFIGIRALLGQSCRGRRRGRGPSLPGRPMAASRPDISLRDRHLVRGRPGRGGGGDGASPPAHGRSSEHRVRRGRRQLSAGSPADRSPSSVRRPSGLSTSANETDDSSPGKRHRSLLKTIGSWPSSGAGAGTGWTSRHARCHGLSRCPRAGRGRLPGSACPSPPSRHVSGGCWA